MGKKPPQEIGIKVKNHSGDGVSLTHNKNFRKLLKEIIGESAPRLTELNTKEFAGFQVGLLNKVSCDTNSLYVFELVWDIYVFHIYSSFETITILFWTS